MKNKRQEAGEKTDLMWLFAGMETVKEKYNYYFNNTKLLRPMCGIDPPKKSDVFKVIMQSKK